MFKETRYAYPAVLEPGDIAGYVVTFPDVPEAITQGDDRADALEQASDALGTALLSYFTRGLPLPPVGSKGRGSVMVDIAPDVAAKIAVLQAFAASRVTKTELARRIKRDEKEVRRILDPFHRTKLANLTEALAALGMALRVSLVPKAA